MKIQSIDSLYKRIDSFFLTYNADSVIYGVKTRLGTVRTPYEHFYAWRRVNEGDAVSTLPFAETETMIKGVYAPERFMEIFRDYIYFQDSIYDSDEVEIICRYPQFFAAKLLKQRR